MKRSNLMTAILVGQMVQMMLVISSAFALTTEGSRAQVQQEYRAMATGTRIEGMLALDGNGALMINEGKSGRRYRLINADSAKKLYDTGAFHVAIEGTFSNADTIQVSSAEKN